MCCVPCMSQWIPCLLVCVFVVRVLNDLLRTPMLSSVSIKLAHHISSSLARKLDKQVERKRNSKLLMRCIHRTPRRLPLW
uniref:Putative secreted protein n=1 Tax=Rhipicephalus microplus TaxID=6941 RepID=A0A6M2DB07_RHIMP